MINEDANLILSEKDEKYVDVMDEYNENPKDPKANNKAGIYYSKNGLYILAERYLKKTISLDKKNVKAYTNPANLYLMLEMYDKAIKNYKEALKLEPDNSRIRSNFKKAKSEKDKQ